MIRKIQEDIACGAEYTLMYRNHVLLHTITDKAAAEYETEEEQNEDYNNHNYELVSYYLFNNKLRTVDHYKELNFNIVGKQRLRLYCSS